MPLVRERYEPLEVVGRGGQGEVIRAVDRRHDRVVALKVRRWRSAEERDGLLQEARILLQLEPHPNLPLVREDFFVGDRYCIVMDWIAGSSMAQVVHGAQPSERSPEVVLDVLDQVAAALDHLHAHDVPVVHLDVKPANIVRRTDGRAVLVDFGLAGHTLASTPYARGTSTYLAPELATGGPVSPAADLFSLAVTACELLTGDPPVPGRTPDLSDVPERWAQRLRRGLARGLASDPRQRPPTAAAFVELLRPPTAPTNVPASVSSFVGRARELEELKQRLRRDRIVTLVGPGGVGKTRLAAEAAGELSSSFTDGVWVVDLTGISDTALLPEGVATKLGIADAATSAVEGLAGSLGTGRQLLVLDNCEHVVSACARLVEHLLGACPSLTVVATSREALRVDGEVVWAVPSMAVPPRGAAPGTTEAERLFRERARSAAPRTEPTHEARTVAEICRRLDGLPLAIELAAAALAEHGIHEIARGLGQALDVLDKGRRAVPRHETMRSALAWSYGRLTGFERALFPRLAVFSGAFDVRAASAVCCASGDERALCDEALRALAAKSLCSAEPGEDASRYRLLQTVRQYASELLEASGSGDRVRADHADWYAHLASGDPPDERGRSRRMDRLEAGLEDVLEALSWSVERRPELGLAMAAALQDFWETRGHATEGRLWLDRALEGAVGPTADRAAALYAAGRLALLQGAYGRARSRAGEGLALYRQLGDDDGIVRTLNLLALEAQYRGDLGHARTTLEEALRRAPESRADRTGYMTLHNLAIVLLQQRDFAGARAIFEDVLERAREAGNRRDEALALANLGTLAGRLRSDDEARARDERALELFEELGDEDAAARVRNDLGCVLGRQGKLDDAQLLLEDALRSCDELGNVRGAALARGNLALILRRRGERGAARDLYRRNVLRYRETDERRGVADSLIGLAATFVDDEPASAAGMLVEALTMQLEADDPDLCPAALEVMTDLFSAARRPAEAGRLLGAAEALRARTHQPMDPAERDEHARRTAAIHAELGAEEFDRVRNAGALMTLTEVRDRLEETLASEPV